MRAPQVEGYQLINTCDSCTCRDAPSIEKAIRLYISPCYLGDHGGFTVHLVSNTMGSQR